MERLYKTYGDRVTFQVVYIMEAHPGSILSVPLKDGGAELQIIPPTTTVENRLENLRQFIKVVGLTIPSGIDGLDDAARIAYSGWPDRIYVIGANGKIALKSGPGPAGFKIADLEAWLRTNVP
jgi:type I thyroxine 5'-deiodinase